MTVSRLPLLMIAILLLFGLGGCSTLSTKKIPQPSERQRDAVITNLHLRAVGGSFLLYSNGETLYIEGIRTKGPRAEDGPEIMSLYGFLHRSREAKEEEVVCTKRECDRILFREPFRIVTQEEVPLWEQTLERLVPIDTD